MQKIVGTCEACSHKNENLSIVRVVHERDRYIQLLCDSCIEGIERLGFVACHQCDYLHDGYDKEFCLPCKNEYYNAVKAYAQKFHGELYYNEELFCDIASSSDFCEWLTKHYVDYEGWVSKSDYFVHMTNNMFVAF